MCFSSIGVRAQPSIKDDQIEDIKNQVRKLDLICDLEDAINEACDCSFFFWSRAMVPHYFKDIFENPDQAQKLQYMFGAFRDVVPLFATTFTPEDFVTAYKKEIDTALHDNILKPLCDAIEVRPAHVCSFVYSHFSCT